MSSINEEIDRIFKARKNRTEHPDGTFDNGGRWYPNESEECKCCSDIRQPSRRWPYSLMKHYRTRKHIRCLVMKKRGIEVGNVK